MRMGVVGMSKTLAREVGPDNILVNVIGPGRIGTDRILKLNAMRAEKAGYPWKITKNRPEELPSGPLWPFGRIRPAGCFLCSEANSYVSGQTILLDGAMTKAY